MVNIWLKHLVRCYLPVYQFKSDKMRIAFAGYSSKMRKYFIRFLNVSENNRTYLGRKWFQNIPNLIKSGNYDMIIAETSPLTFSYFNKLNGFLIPASARMRLNINRPIEEICKRSVSDFSDIMRKIRKYNLTYEILTDIESLNYFKNSFYLPYITKRHGDEVWFDDLNTLWELSPTSFLLAIKEYESVVGMSLLSKSGNSYNMLHIGLLNGEDKYLSHGVIGAMYYFAMLEGKKEGYQYLDLGGARPFLTDTLTRYKMGLGAEFVKENFSKNGLYFWLGVNEQSASFSEFVQSNPFMYLIKDNMLVSTIKSS